MWEVFRLAWAVHAWWTGSVGKAQSPVTICARLDGFECLQ